MNQPININEKFSKFSEHWRPKIVAQLNGQDFKLAKIQGEYPFHADAERPQSIRGMDCSEAPEPETVQGNAEPAWVPSVIIKEGECIVVPKGLRHRPRAEEECLIFLIEPNGVKNSGDADVEAKYDAPLGEWV